jgi:maltose O-acetyltransferase
MMTPGTADTSTDAAPARRFSLTLREDFSWGLEHIVFTRLLGWALMPRVARRLLLVAAGASVESGPGGGFSVVGSPKNLTIGRGTYLNRNVHIEAIAPVSIGRDSALGMEVMIVTSHHELSSTGAWDPRATGRPVLIGERVWIGARVTILPGAVIEDDVVVAAGAVVTGTLRAHGIYAGVPAKRIRDKANAQAPAEAEAGVEAAAPSGGAPVAR